MFGEDTASAFAAAGVDEASVSLNAPDAETYVRFCPSRFDEEAYDAVKRFILSCVEAGIAVRATIVDLPEFDEAVIERCRVVAEEELGVEFVVRPYGPLG